MNDETIQKLNEDINDKMDLIKSFVIDQLKEIEILKTKMLQEIYK